MIRSSPAKSSLRRRLPAWFRVSLEGGRERDQVRALLQRSGLHTVCESAQCPNRCECWSRRAATFMIMGEICTRNCRFCAVDHGSPSELQDDEPQRIAAAAQELGLKHVVVTSVTRDDLPDGGASHFARVINALRQELPTATIEVLTPDFGGCNESIEVVTDARPDIFNHNIETCERLTQAIRSGADYHRSLAVLASARQRGDVEMTTKSGFMLGLGEHANEVHSMLSDLRAAGVSIVTIGQYLTPSQEHWPVAEYVEPELFAQWGEVARGEYGFDHVMSGPRVRSSYLADLAAP